MEVVEQPAETHRCFRASVSGGSGASGTDARHRCATPLRPPPWCSEAPPTRTLVDEQLRRITRLAVAAVPAGHMAEVVVMCDHGPVSRGATDPVSEAIAALRRRIGRGPSIEAWVRGEAVHADTAAIAARWPERAAQAEEFGVAATLAVPVAAGDAPVGTLTLYAPIGRGFSRDDERAAGAIAEKVAVVLAGLGLRAASTEVRQLQEALRSRATIEQAKGILIALHHCNPDEAFARLTTRSQHENRKLRDVAADLVADLVAEHVAEHVAPGSLRPRRRPPPFGGRRVTPLG